MHARAQASHRLAKANRARHGPRVRGKGQSKEKKGKSKGTSKGTKGAKGRKLVSQVLKTRNQRHARKLRNLHSHVPLTLPGTMVGIVPNGTMAGVLMNGMMTGVLMNEMMTGVLLDGTKVGNKRMTLPQAHFHMEVWILVPPVVRSGLNGRR